MIAEASHVNDPDETVLTYGLQQLLYTSYRDALSRMTTQDVNVLDAFPRAHLDRTMVILPRFIPLPVGTKLPPGILTTAVVRIPGGSLVPTGKGMNLGRITIVLSRWARGNASRTLTSCVVILLNASL